MIEIRGREGGREGLGHRLLGVCLCCGLLSLLLLAEGGGWKGEQKLDEEQKEGKKSIDLLISMIICSYYKIMLTSANISSCIMHFLNHFFT